MTAKEFVSGMPLGPGDARANLLYARLLFSYLADHIYVAELGNGCEVHDATDFAKFCREVIEEAHQICRLSEGRSAAPTHELRAGPKVAPMPQPRWKNNHTCPDCDHEHEGREECAYYLGEGNFCHCPSKVTA